MSLVLSVVCYPLGQESAGVFCKGHTGHTVSCVITNSAFVAWKEAENTQINGRGYVTVKLCSRISKTDDRRSAMSQILGISLIDYLHIKMLKWAQW